MRSRARDFGVEGSFLALSLHQGFRDLLLTERERLENLGIDALALGLILALTGELFDELGDPFGLPLRRPMAFRQFAQNAVQSSHEEFPTALRSRPSRPRQAKEFPCQ